ncbi:MAG: hypothetical protein RIA08_08425 [Roseovarius sp.]|uniref:COG3904 family protein n=1 Tax=Roseovarius sp. TaxID=1486281 RepID=UPI0032EC2EF9
MTFVLGGTDERSNDATWIQAEGEITSTTFDDFLAFMENGPDWFPNRIRLNSPGGNLLVGIRLGEEFRRRGFATEVGGHEPHPDWPDMPYWDFTRRIPGICASACAYAFMGGTERRIDFGSRIGVHQFYSGEDNPSAGPVLVQEGVEQVMVALLLDYTLRMGVDGRVLVNAGLSGPDEMHWIETGAEAEVSGLIHDPAIWTNWDIEMEGEGLIAVSTRTDGKSKMTAFCDWSSGAYFYLDVTEETSGKNDWSLRSWLVEQCLPAGSMSQGAGAHSILGNRVGNQEIGIVDRGNGFSIRFRLGRNPSVNGSPSFLYEDAPFTACNTERFSGNAENMVSAVRLAFRNCIR